MSCMTPTAELCENNSHGISLVDKPKKLGAWTPMVGIAYESKNNIKAAIYKQLVNLALSNTRAEMTTEIDAIRHNRFCFDSAFKKKKLDFDPISFNEYKIIAHLDSKDLPSINYNSNCYVSFATHEHVIEIMFRNIKTGAYQIMFIPCTMTMAYNITCWGPFGGSGELSELPIYYNELQNGTELNIMGHLGYISSLFKSIPETEWKERHPLYSLDFDNESNNSASEDASDEICKFLKPSKELTCFDDELEFYSYEFIHRFEREFCALKEQLKYLVYNVDKDEEFSDIVSMTSANDIAKLYLNSVSLFHSRQDILNKKYVMNVTQHIKLSDLYDVWFSRSLKKKHCEGIDSVFNGTLGEFCIKYDIKKIIKTIPGIGKQTAEDIDRCINHFTYNIMSLGMDPLE